MSVVSFVRLSLLFCLALGLSACARTDEDRVEDVIDELVSALNDHDAAGVGALYMDGAVSPLGDAGDSSIIYRMLHIPDGRDFDAEDVQVAVIEEMAQATFYLSGDVSREGSVAGRMQVRLTLDLAKIDELWKIVPGGERPAGL